MNKYTLVLYSGIRQSFLERLQALGAVDITTTGWEPDESEHAILTQIEQHRSAGERFKSLAQNPDYQGAEPFATGDEAFAAYLDSSARIESLESQIAKCRKEADELSAWGNFDPQKIESLATAGIVLHFYQCYTSEFAHNIEAWSAEYNVEPIAELNGTTYFVVIASASDAQPAIDAQTVRTPALNVADKEAEIAELQERLKIQQGVMARCTASAELVASHLDELKDSLQFSQVSRSGDTEVDGKINVLEGFAPVENEKEVDAFLDTVPDMFYMKSDAKVDDNPPVKLKNNRFARTFEWIGDFYSLPKYGTMDLTPYFAPFYMLFFGFCISDAGYGLLFLIAGIFMTLKNRRNPQMELISQLVVWLGLGTVLFGLLIGSFFGVPLTDSPLMADAHKSVMQFVNEQLFYIALCTGGVQLLFGMTLKVINTSNLYGFKYSLGTLGWLIILLSCICGYLLPVVGVAWYSFGSIPFYVTLGVGVVMMLFLHNPDKNPLVNFGSGLWNTYNNVTGLLGDVLSYVRLFALSLSGSALALVFNDLAFSLAPEIPVVRQLVIFLILAIGHGMNIFMSAIGAFAHPMRLTFVEFYKAAGFESSERPYKPFAKIKQTK